jgi:hypothetical protein
MQIKSSTREQVKAFFESLADLENEAPPPPITASPSDLLMLLEHAVGSLRRICDDPAGNFAEVVMSASVIRQAVDFWLKQAEEFVAEIATDG